jgi:hypothetical protein
MEDAPVADSVRERILDACSAALALAPDSYPEDLTTTESLTGAPGWYPFEHKAWSIGEDVRQWLLRQPKLKRDPSIQQAIINVIRCVNLRRGRQSFVMLVGFTAAQGWAPTIAEYLDDPDIYGHALDTLLKMRAPGYAARVQPLLASKFTWIRNLARKYMERYSAP